MSDAAVKKMTADLLSIMEKEHPAVTVSSIIFLLPAILIGIAPTEDFAWESLGMAERQIRETFGVLLKEKFK
jgi:hypothetical protein